MMQLKMMRLGTFVAVLTVGFLSVVGGCGRPETTGPESKNSVTAGNGSARPPADEPFRFPEATHKKGELKYVEDLPVLILEGSPEEIGEQHGELVGQPAAPLLEYPKRFIARKRREAEWPLIVAMGHAMMTNVPDSYRTELETAVHTSGFDADVLSVANTMLELRRLGGCSALIVEGDRSAADGPLFGRNFDFDPLGVLDKYNLVMVYRPEGKQAFACVGFPFLGGVLSGMNEAGLSVATLDVYASSDGSPIFEPQGTPLAFLFRRILEECTTVAEAEELLRSAKRTTWMNLAVCDEQGGAIFEITPGNVVTRRPDNGLLNCTNHFRTENLATSTSCRRYQNLEKGRDLEQLDLTDVGRLLHDVHQGPWTIQTMIFEPKARTLHLAVGKGPTSAGPLKPLHLAPLFERSE